MALVELRIGDLAVIESARLPLGPGLTALTGETGAGKSVCIGALRLALGGRVEGDPVRPGADRAVVAAVFDAVTPAVRERLEALGVPDDELLTLSRELPRAGRSVCRVNGALVSQAVLRELGECLVETTAQGESHRLLAPSRQRELLDAFGGEALQATRASVRVTWSAWRQAEEALAEARRRACRSGETLERAREVVASLQPLRLRPGEDDDLAAERLRLRHAVRLAGVAVAVRDVCSERDDAPGIADTLARALDDGRSLAGVDRGVDLLVDEGADLVERLRELAARARRCAEGLVVDADRLAAVEDRLDLLDRVRRRHGGSLESACAELAAAERTLADGDEEGATVARLAEEEERRRQELMACAARLTEQRQRSAAHLERAVVTRLRQLRLPHARFRVMVQPRVAADLGTSVDRVPVCGPEGADEVEMRLATNPDGVPLPLTQAPSGGELSRLALALRAVVALADDCPTLVLDEVDTGIGGETAARVGDALAGIARDRQVVVVTHRAEIAARAGCHLSVTKLTVDGRARSTVTEVRGERRRVEVARLMSGAATGAALARADELLGDGRIRPSGARRRLG